MPQIKKVLATVHYTPEDLKSLRSIFADIDFVHVDHKDTAAIVRELADTDVAILATDLDDRFLENGDLKWIHCDHAGLNKSARPEVFERGIILTGSAGRSAPALAEHCFYFMLLHCYRVREFLQAQSERRWGVEGMLNLRGLNGKTIGIVGMGNTGKEVTAVARVFGMRIISYDRYLPVGFDYIERQLNASAGDTVEPLLQEADFVVLCMQLTDQTYHMISDAQFRIMKSTAMLVNISRGSIVDEPALERALDAGEIAGAGLDVFEVEPLPALSSLWNRENVFITPHNTPAVQHRDGRSIAIIRENLRRYLADEPMLNQVKPEDAWTKDLNRA